MVIVAGADKRQYILGIGNRHRVDFCKVVDDLSRDGRRFRRQSLAQVRQDRFFVDVRQFAWDQRPGRRRVQAGFSNPAR